MEISTEKIKRRRKIPLMTTNVHIFGFQLVFMLEHTFSVLRENNFFHKLIYCSQLPESKLKSVIRGRHLKFSMFLSLHSFR